LLYSDNRTFDCFSFYVDRILGISFLPVIAWLDRELETPTWKNNMSYAIETEIEKDYIRLTVSGEQTLENNKELVFRVIEACTENNIWKTTSTGRYKRCILGQPGIFSDYELANIAAKEALGLISKGGPNRSYQPGPKPRISFRGRRKSTTRNAGH
jgi:hypothetical protein